MATQQDPVRRLALVAGRASHPPGLHEFRAGALLLADGLASMPGLAVQVYSQGEIPEVAADEVDAIVVYADGGPSHPALEGERLAALEELAAQGVGLGFMHYAVEVPLGRGDAELTRWIGGHYLDGFSCNPIWPARFDVLPDHPITRGVHSFATTDEWYFSIRFAQPDPADVPGLQPILVATPSDEVRAGPYVWPAGPYDHVVAASGRTETLMWALERPDGGRGFGLTGGHVHANWADEDFRRLVLNALVWVSGAEVPTGGVESAVSDAALAANLDDKPG